MSQKPVHERTPDACREAAWSAVSLLAGAGEEATFSVRDVVELTALGKDTVRDYFRSLAAAGFLQEAGTRWVPACRRHAQLYRLVKDSITAPRVRRDGTVITAGVGRRNMWRSARMLKEFTAAELAAFSSTPGVTVAPREAESYLTWLVKAGYVSVESVGRRGRGVSRYRFNFDRYTGPRPPQVQRRKQVFDANLGKVVWPLPVAA